MSVVINGTDGITYNDGSLQPSAIGKNLFINGDMRIAQRGTSATGIITSGYYTCDRWRIASNIGTFTNTQDTDAPTGQGFSYSYKLACTSTASLTTTSLLLFQQLIEGQNLQHIKKGTASAESLTLSFWVKSNKTGTHIAELYENANVRSISSQFTISSADTWEKKTITYAGDATGEIVNNNTTGITLNLWVTTGTNYSSGTLATSWEASTSANRAVGQNINLADSISNYINITGVQLEVGTTATPFEHRPYDMELQRCERYFQKCGVWNGCANSSTNWLGVVSAHTTMRVSPSVGQSGVLQVSDYFATDATQSTTSLAILTSNNTTLSLCIWMFNFSGLVGGKYYGGIRASVNGNYITLSAEL